MSRAPWGSDEGKTSGARAPGDYQSVEPGADEIGGSKTRHPAKKYILTSKYSTPLLQ